MIFSRFFLSLLLALTLLAGCSSGDDDDDSTAAETDDDDDDDNDDNDNNDDNDDNDDDEATACWADLPVGEKAIFAQGFDMSEGIAFSAAGELFVANRTAVSLVHPIGIAFAPDGDLYVCDFGASSLPAPNDGAIYKIGPGYAKTLVATGVANPNFITYTPRGTFLVSDNETATIYELTLGGELTHWLDGLVSPDGMVYSPDRQTLYVAGTIAPGSPLFAVSLDAAGLPLDFAVLAELDKGSWPDGVALDENGMVYVTENLSGKIVRVDPATGDFTALAAGMEGPASMAFGAGPDFDPCSLYVTELRGTHVWRVSVGAHAYPLVAEE